MHGARLQPVPAQAIGIRPGAPVGYSVCNPRRDVAQWLARHTPVDRLPRVLAMAFNLCGHAHQLAATLALRAAGANVPEMPDAAASLRRETFLEHLRRMHLDWPRLLAAPEHVVARQQAALEPIGASPLRADWRDGAASWVRARQWLQAQWLGMPPADWLAGWDAAPQAWLHAWTRGRHHWLADCLRHALRFDTDLGQAHRPLDERAPQSVLARFGDDVLREPALSCQPVWRGRCRHTGTWTRTAGSTLTASHMLGSRLAEAVRLALDAAELAAVAHAWHPHRAVASVPMARGRLMHVVEWVRTSPRVANYRVIAPTEWNFHPRGALAQAVSALPSLLEAPHEARTKAQVLMAAFDPCVAFELHAWQPEPARGQPCMS